MLQARRDVVSNEPQRGGGTTGGLNHPAGAGLSL